MTLSENDVGRRYTGPSKTLTDAHFLMYSAVSSDVHPIHYDVEYAKNSSFGSPVAHGLLLAGLMALGASDAKDDIEGFAMVEQGSRFLKPVMVGDTVRPQFELEKIWQDGNRKFCRFKTSLLNHEGETLVEGFHLYRILPQKSAGGGGHG
jgi:acyl dehydratase